MKKLLATVAGIAAIGAAVAWASTVRADEIKPAILYDLGGKFDKSFNEGVYNGGQSFAKATGIEVRDFEMQNATQREQALRTFAKRGQNPILAVGFAQASALSVVAKEFPNTKFAIIDGVVEAPNVQSILFREEEGSYLAGVLAALKTPGGKIGFVGGMDIPLIRRFECGYAQGAKATDPSIEVYQNMTGTTPSAWTDPVRGGELAKSQFEKGASVVFAAAGATGLGVLQTAADTGKLAIGVDSNQNFLYPGHILTSMLKRVDIATQTTFSAAKDGTWKPGIIVLGLAQNGVGLAFDENNAKLVTDADKSKIDQVTQDILSGKIKVHNYTDDNKCPV